ncbi:MAG: amidase, partial [Acidimicrobiales bacterium]
MDTVIATAEAVRRGERSAVEVLEEALAAIDASNPPLNAFVHLAPDLAREAAQAVDARRARGEDPGPLAGVPFGVKDLEDCAGMPTSMGSLLYQGRPAVGEDSVHVARLRAAGAVPVGKTAVPELGAVSFTSSRAWGPTRNPWDPSRTPGGSSGGSAAAVAAGMVPFCTGSDGGGSIRIPAAYTGLVGFKPSFGRIPQPRRLASETSVLGALTTTVADAARHLDASAGPDDRDRTSLPAQGSSYEKALDELDVGGRRACWSPDLGYAVVEPEAVERAERAALALADAAGLELVERPVQLTDPVLTWLAAGAADLWMDLEDGMWPGRADELDEVAHLGLLMTATTTMADFARALHQRARLEQEVAALFADVDVLLTPTTAGAAFAAEGPMPSVIAGQEVFPAMAVPFTMLANLCWNPAVSVPAGLTSLGLPVGLQVVG